MLVAISKGMRAVKLHQQNSAVLNWRCLLTQVDEYNGHKTGGWLVCEQLSVKYVVMKYDYLFHEYCSRCRFQSL